MENGDILAQAAPEMPSAHISKPPHKKRKISVLGVIFTIILAIVIILLGERIIFDLNRVANPIVEKEYSTVQRSGTTTTMKAPSSRTYSSDRSTLSRTKIYYPKEDDGTYRAYKLLIHTSFIIPIFLLTFLLYYLFNVRLRSDHLMVVMWGYMAFALWMIIRLVIEAISYIVKQFPNAGIYVVLLLLGIVFTLLAIFIQKKVAEHHHRVS